jgi:hypothetical protein
MEVEIRADFGKKKVKCFELNGKATEQNADHSKLLSLTTIRERC